MQATEEVLRDATNLLRAELPDDRLAHDTAYLRWCYRANPGGGAIERYHYIDGDDGEPLLVAHYLHLKRRYIGPAGEYTDGGWSMHAVTRSGHQRSRHFVRLAHEIIAEAAAGGLSFVVGVANDKSVGSAVKYIGFRNIGPLPVRVIAPFAGRGAGMARRMTHVEATEDWLHSAEFAAFAARIDHHSPQGWSTDWHPEVLRWRLSCPFTRYWVHIADDLALVTTRTVYARLPVTVVLKIFPLLKTDSSHRPSLPLNAGPSTKPSPPLNAGRAIRAVTVKQRSAFAVYAGFNASVRVGGIAPPRRLQPSPLNLVIRSYGTSIDQEGLKLDTFEFLDMDAY